jgi:hypothetical protein
MKIPEGLGGKSTLMNGPKRIAFNKTLAPMYGLKFVPPPIHDYLNFKNMSSNEILVNLNNHEHLPDSELVGGMIELTSRARTAPDVDWNEHHISAKCIADLKHRQSRMKAKHVAQIQLILVGLKVNDPEFWQQNANYTLRLLHKYKARDMAQFMDVFDRELLDDEGEPVFLNKATPVFFERIAGLLPMFIKDMNNA